MPESITINKSISKEEKYKQLLPQIKSLIDGENDLTANLANICAALKYGMDKFFWVGFYLRKDDESASKPDSATAELILGPFQGPVACTRIKIPDGVCGTAVKEMRTIIVDDVNTFPGHIACSADSKSEIVVPIYSNVAAPFTGAKPEIFGVLDVDSDSFSNFDSTDAKYLEEICSIVSELTP
jgi:L-methionine (R)-S-oxide reductase